MGWIEFKIIEPITQPVRDRGSNMSNMKTKA